jgi:hypothetical protein
MLNNYIFDNDFYVNFYPDIKNAILNENTEPYQHYLSHGKKEKRVCCQDELNDTITNNLKLINEQHIFLQNFEFKMNEQGDSIQKAMSELKAEVSVFY